MFSTALGLYLIPPSIEYSPPRTPNLNPHFQVFDKLILLLLALETDHLNFCYPIFK